MDEFEMKTRDAAGLIKRNLKDLEKFESFFVNKKFDDNLTENEARDFINHMALTVDGVTMGFTLLGEVLHEMLEIED